MKSRLAANLQADLAGGPAALVPIRQNGQTFYPDGRQAPPNGENSSGSPEVAEAARRAPQQKVAESRERKKKQLGCTG